jgi:hypothetical protein
VEELRNKKFHSYASHETIIARSANMIQGLKFLSDQILCFFSSGHMGHSIQWLKFEQMPKNVSHLTTIGRNKRNLERMRTSCAVKTLIDGRQTKSVGRVLLCVVSDLKIFVLNNSSAFSQFLQQSSSLCGYG